MTERDHLKDLKQVTKDMARARQIALHDAQNEVATWLGFPHWVALITKIKSGHRLTDADIDEVAAKVQGEELYPPQGEINGHPYHLCESLHDVFLHGRGWRIVVFEAPSAQPLVSVTDRRIARNPINDPAFVEAALTVARWKADQVRQQIARDWPRSSLKPDPDGMVTHPLFGESSKEWYCLHCDEKTIGPDMARNFWHCPHCGATPLDMHSWPWWNASAEAGADG